MGIARRPVETGVTEGEHTTVGGDQPVAEPVAPFGPAHHRLGQVVPGQRAQCTGHARVVDAPVGTDELVTVQRAREVVGCRRLDSGTGVEETTVDGAAPCAQGRRRLAQDGGHLRSGQCRVGGDDKRRRGRHVWRRHGGAALHRVVPVVPRREHVYTGRGDVGRLAVLGEVEVSVTTGGVYQGLVGPGGDREDSGVRSWVHRLGRVEVARRRHHHYTVGYGVLDGRFGVGVRAAVCGCHTARLVGKGQVDDPGAGRNGVVDPGRLVHGVAFSLVVKDLDVERPCLPAEAGHPYAIVGVGRDQTGHEGAVAVVVPGRGAQRPVVGTDIRPDDDFACQLCLGNIDACVEHCDQDVGAAPGYAPSLGGIDGPQVGLAVRVHNRRSRTGGGVLDLYRGRGPARCRITGVVGDHVRRLHGGRLHGLHRRYIFHPLRPRQRALDQSGLDDGQVGCPAPPRQPLRHCAREAPEQ